MNGALQPSHWIILLIVAFLFFVVFGGSKKIPDAARGLGRGLRIFKSEMSALQSDGNGEEAYKEKSADTNASPKISAEKENLLPEEAQKSDIPNTTHRRDNVVNGTKANETLYTYTRSDNPQEHNYKNVI